MARYDENGDYIVDPPQSRIEARIAKLEELIEKGGGGGDVPPDDPANTATAADVDNIKDSIQW